jgi:hypothetical protein
MNLSAVAFTADSAVTMSRRRADGRGQLQYQAGVEKVYLVDDKGPIGAMVFGRGDFSGCPWNVAFQAFREQTPKTPPTVVHAVQSIVAFLAGADENKKLPLSEDTSENNLYAYISIAVLRFRELTEEVADAEAALAAESPQAKKLALYQKALAHLDREARYYPQYGDKPEPRGKIGEATPRLQTLFQKHFNPFLEDALKNFFPDEAIPDQIKAKLASLLIETFLTDWIPDTPYKTGVVVAGFGSEEVTPAFVHIDVFGCIGGVLKYSVENYARTNTEQPLVVEPFALSNPIRAFLFGADPLYEAGAEIGVRHYLAEGMSGLYTEIGKKDSKLAEALKPQMVDMVMDVPVKGLSVGFRAYSNELHEKLAAMLNSASDRTLAGHAERLLQFAVLKHELTGDQSVSQPISTLFMSRGRYEFRRP